MRYFKLVILIIVIISSLFILTGCASTYYEENEPYKSNTSDRFIKIKQWIDERGSINEILYDKETKVQYLKIYGNGITVLLDTEGKPLLYEGEQYE